jgi:hypothetical protein
LSPPESRKYATTMLPGIKFLGGGINFISYVSFRGLE